MFDATSLDQNPVNIAFVIFSSIKRVVGLSKNKPSHRYTIGISTAVSRRCCGFTGASSQTASFSYHLPDGVRGCPRSWDSVLGHRWDVLPAIEQDRLDTFVKTLRFTEHREFGLYTIRCSINTCNGRYRDDPDYRAIMIHNYYESERHPFEIDNNSLSQN